MSTAKTERSRLGDLLVEMRLVDEATMRSVLAEHRTSGRRVARILAEKRLLEEDRLTRAVCSKLGLEAVSVAGVKIHDQVLALVPAPIALEHGVLPIAVKRTNQADVVYLVMADPLDTVAIGEVQRVTGRQVRVLMAKASEVDQALTAHYGEDPSASASSVELRSRRAGRARGAPTPGRVDTAEPSVDPTRGPAPAAESKRVPPAPRAADPVHPPTPRADPVRPPTPRADPVRPPTLRAVDPVRPPTPRAVEPVRPPTPRAGDPVRPPTPRAVDPVRPPTPRGVDPVRPPTPRAVDPVRPPTPRAVDPVRPPTSPRLDASSTVTMSASASVAGSSSATGRPTFTGSALVREPPPLAGLGRPITSNTRVSFSAREHPPVSASTPGAPVDQRGAPVDDMAPTENEVDISARGLMSTLISAAEPPPLTAEPLALTPPVGRVDETAFDQIEVEVDVEVSESSSEVDSSPGPGASTRIDPAFTPSVQDLEPSEAEPSEWARSVRSWESPGFEGEKTFDSPEAFETLIGAEADLAVIGTDLAEIDRDLGDEAPIDLGVAGIADVDSTEASDDANRDLTAVGPPDLTAAGFDLGVAGTPELNDADDASGDEPVTAMGPLQKLDWSDEAAVEIEVPLSSPTVAKGSAPVPDPEPETPSKALLASALEIPINWTEESHPFEGPVAGSLQVGLEKTAIIPASELLGLEFVPPPLEDAAPVAALAGQGDIPTSNEAVEARAAHGGFEVIDEDADIEEVSVELLDDEDMVSLDDEGATARPSPPRPPPKTDAVPVLQASKLVSLLDEKDPSQEDTGESERPHPGGPPALEDPVRAVLEGLTEDFARNERSAKPSPRPAALANEPSTEGLGTKPLAPAQQPSTAATRHATALVAALRSGASLSSAQRAELLLALGRVLLDKGMISEAELLKALLE